MACCSVSLKNVYNVTHGIVANIHCKTAPCFKGVTETEFMRDVKKDLSFLVSSATEDTSRKVSGEQALQET